MIHWDGSAVTGFIVPEANNEYHALKLLKKSLYISLLVQKSDPSRQSTHGELSADRVKSFLRSLKRPWRRTRKDSRLVNIERLQLPTYSGHWLMDILSGQYNCNICPNTWEPRPR